MVIKIYSEISGGKVLSVVEESTHKLEKREYQLKNHKY